MGSLSGFKIALIGLVLFMGLSAGGLLLYTYLNSPAQTAKAPEPTPKIATGASQAEAPIASPPPTPPSSLPKRPSPTTPSTPLTPPPLANNPRPVTPPPVEDNNLPKPPSRSSAGLTPTAPKEEPNYQPPTPISEGGIVNIKPGENNETPINGPVVPGSLLNQPPPGYRGEGGNTTIITPQGPNVKKEILADRFFFNNLSPSAVTGANISVKGGGETEVDPKKFAPRGEDIEAVILDNVAGNNFEIPVAAAVWYDFYYQRNLLLPTGTKLLGTAAKGKFRNRLNISFNRAIFTNGKSVALNGLGLDLDGTVGVPGQLIGNVLLDNLGPVLLQAASDIVNRLKERQTQLLTSTSTGFFGTNQVQSETLVEKDNIANALLDASGNAFQKIQQLITQDLEENKPFVLVPAGTRVRIRLMSNLEISGADYGK